MYAVIRTGGKQYKVAPEDVLQIEKIDGAAGDAVQFADVLMIGGEGEPAVGAPLVAGAAVSAEVVEQGRGPKVIIFKKRRQNYRRKKGHRQDLTTVRILEIFTDGKAPVLVAKESSEPAAVSEAKPAKPRAKKPAAEAGAEAPANAAAQAAEMKAPAPEAEVKKAKAAKPKAEEGAEPKAAAPKKPRAKKAE